MSLRVKFLCLLVFVPAICLGYFLYFATSTFVTYRTADVFESQLQLLNSAHLFLSKAATSELPARIKEIVSQEGFESLLVTDLKGQVRYAANEELVGHTAADIFGSGITERLANQSTQEGSFELVDSRKQKVLVSFFGLDVDGDRLVFLLSRAKSAAVRASTLFLYKALATFAALVSFAILISILFSNQITKGLGQLARAMQAVGAGDLAYALPRAGSDEVGLMTQQFQALRNQLRLLINESKKQAESEAEMRLAGDLQKRFFPPATFQDRGVELAAHFEAASHAGGDWWFHFRHGTKLVFLIGDVTGHGLNAAMMTGVCRSALSLIQDAYTSPAESLSLLNRAIFDSSMSQMHMTCTFCSLDSETGQLAWANASHYPPLIAPVSNDPLKPSDFRFLLDVGGPRLGQSRDAQYAEGTAQLADGESVLLYSDGLVELQSSTGATWSEKKMLRAVGAKLTSKLTASEIVGIIKAASDQHRAGFGLNDDLSFMAVKWRKPA